MKLHKNVRIHRQKNKDQYCELPGQLIRNPYYTVSAQPSRGIRSSQFQLGVTSVEFRLLLPAAICLYIFCLYIFCLSFPPPFFESISNLFWTYMKSKCELTSILPKIYEHYSIGVYGYVQKYQPLPSQIWWQVQFIRNMSCYMLWFRYS